MFFLPRDASDRPIDWAVFAVVLMFWAAVFYLACGMIANAFKALSAYAANLV